MAKVLKAVYDKFVTPADLVNPGREKKQPTQRDQGSKWEKVCGLL